MEISIIQGNEKMPFLSEVTQSRELNLVLRKTAMILRVVPLAVRSIP